MPGAHKIQKKVTGLLSLELQRVVSCHGCWEPSVGPVQEQQVFLTTKPSAHTAPGFLLLVVLLKYSLQAGQVVTGYQR